MKAIKDSNVNMESHKVGVLKNALYFIFFTAVHYPVAYIVTVNFKTVTSLGMLKDFGLIEIKIMRLQLMTYLISPLG